VEICERHREKELCRRLRDNRVKRVDVEIYEHGMDET
jgi:hypothetical protein